MITNNKLFQFMKDNLHLKKYKIEELPTDLVEEIRRTFQIFDVDNGKIFRLAKVNGLKCRVLKMDGPESDKSIAFERY